MSPNTSPPSSPENEEEAVEFELDLNPLTVEDAASSVIDKAAGMNASDLFVLSHEDYVAIHVRHLGRVRKLGIVSNDKGRRLIQHFKVIAEMDVAEHRRPLDGRFMHESEDESIGTVDLRVNAIPTMHGEDLALRLLLRDAKRLQLDQLGLTSKQHGEYRSMIEGPGGLVLCVGPTGAGKTTSLYAAIEHLNDGSRKINTIEDPIEYGIEGVRQTQIAPHIGVGFAEMLRGVLRQSSDVIMVGEVRDEATAQTAVRAANAGRLVLATVHANVATAAVETMLNFGVNPHFLAAGLRGVVAQRLIRTLDPDTRTEVDLSDYDELFEPIRDQIEGEPQLFAADVTAIHGAIGRRPACSRSFACRPTRVASSTTRPTPRRCGRKRSTRACSTSAGPRCTKLHRASPVSKRSSTSSPSSSFAGRRKPGLSALRTTPKRHRCDLRCDARPAG